MAVIFSNKDPNEVLDYAVDWSQRDLEGDEITTFTASVLTGAVTVQSTDHEGLTSTVWLMGGLEGETCTILLRITTNVGRTMDETAKLKIKSR